MEYCQIHKVEYSSICIRCEYGNHGQQRGEDNPRDLTDDIKVPIGYKLIKAYNMNDGELPYSD